MDPIGISIKRPISVAVGVILIILFGIIAIGQIPIQLTPTVDRPTVTIETSWPGRSPQEIVDEITKEQEERLKNVSNLRKMRSTSREGASVIELEFYVGSDLTRALQEVSDKLRQVPSYPDEVDEPTVKSAEGSPENAIAWIIIDVDPELAASLGDFDITTLFDRLDREVKPFLERIDGVAEVNIYGGREREVQVLVDPLALAQRSISPIEVVNALNAENRNVSAGTIAEGKRDYRIRVIGQFTRAEDVMSTVIAYRDGKPVYVKDVASVEISHRKARGFVRSLGQPCLAMNVIRQTNANVVEVMEELRLRLEEVRTEILPNLDERVGPAIRMRQVYDETTYIDAAVGLVTGNLWKGGLLAAVVLLLFLRSASATMAIALAIPISVVGTFLVMVGVGRTLNVISLAGLAFATGMVVDNSIVVLENIDRRRRLGDSPFRAAYRGAREVWGAVLASTLTTLVVFIPVLTIKEEAGQLFRDIALAIAAAVALSLVVSLTVIPAWCSRVVRSVEAPKSRLGRMSASAFGLAPIGASVANVVGRVMRWVISGWRAWTLAPALVVVLTLLSAIGSRALMPPLDYLPAGNRNLVFGGLLIPPGLSIDEQTRIAEVIEGQIKPYSDARPTIPGSIESLPPINRGFGPFVGTTPPFDPVGVDNFFIGAFDGGMFVGATSQDEQVVIPIGQLLTNSMQTIPDAYGGARQTSLFSGGLQGGNTIDLEISGPRLDRVVSAAGMMFGISGQAFGFGNVRANPANFTISQPEWQVRLNRAGRELGLTTRDIGIAVRGLVDGAFIGDFLLDGQAVDMVILPRGGRLDHKEQLAFVPVATPSGRIVPLDSVIDVIPSTAQQEIQRIEELPSVTLQISPEPGQAIETVMQQIREQVVAPAQQAGMIDSSMRVRLEGTAAKLDVVRREMLGSVGEARVGAAPGWAKVGLALLLTVGLGVIGFALLKGVRKYPGSTAAGVLGVSIVFALLAVTFWTVANNPAVGYARLVWALVVTYFVMCALFESFVYPLVIMFSVPLASVGGFLGLRIVHDWTMLDPTMAPQQLDVLTMLGFIILIGTVVNNAILIVENALAAMRGNEYGDPPMPLIDAIEYAVKTRLRPIFMTTATTVGGMLPLVISPGSGSEMYRGLGAVVLGGLVVSTIFTLVVVPVLFSLVIRMQDGFRKAIGAPSVAERLRAKIEDPTSTAPESATGSPA